MAHHAQITSAATGAAVKGVALVHGYTVAFWVSAGLIAFAAVLALVLVKAGPDDVANKEGAAVHAGV